MHAPAVFLTCLIIRYKTTKIAVMTCDYFHRISRLFNVTFKNFKARGGLELNVVY